MNGPTAAQDYHAAEALAVGRLVADWTRDIVYLTGVHRDVAEAALAVLGDAAEAEGRQGAMAVLVGRLLERIGAGFPLDDAVEATLKGDRAVRD